MGDLFLKLLNMSISAGWLAIAVILIRFCIKRAPRWITVAMWALVGVRLICPFTIESALSLIPSAETVPQNIVYADVPAIHTGIGAINSTVNPVIYDSLAPEVGASVNPMQVAVAVAAFIWIAGMAVMLIYTAVSYLMLRRRVREATPLEGNIMLCDHVTSPFILGIIRPRIYLPSDIYEGDIEYVLAHEKAHLNRRDHWWKPLGFLLLTVYWFNPVVWIAYILLCRDIETACDERVLRKLGDCAKAPYSEALINCSVPRRVIAACPLAFGEVGVKTRIKSVLNYKKPAFWVIVIALVLCAVLAVCFLTDPKPSGEGGFQLPECQSGLDGVGIEIIAADFNSEYPYIKIKWYNNRDDTVIFGNRFDVFRYEDGEWVNVRDTGGMMLAFTTVGYLCTPAGTAEKSYPLDYIDMTRPGRYRFVTDCGINGGEPVNYEMAIEIEVKETEDGEYSLVTPSGDAVTTVTTGYLASLERIYPQFFGLNTAKGLEVYWYQMAAGNYNWVLVPGKNSVYTWQELMDLPAASTEEMRAIVNSYGLEQSMVTVSPTWCPYSSYIGPSTDEYYAKVAEMFWSTSPIPENYGAYMGYEVVGVPIYDELAFDIDNDGRLEICQIGMGPTSGLFTFTLIAIENGETEYSNVFYSRWGKLSFSESSDGTVRLCIELYEALTGDESRPYYYDISVVDGSIVLTDESGEMLEGWIIQELGPVS